MGTRVLDKKVRLREVLSRTMMVITIAKTPSLNASKRFGFIESPVDLKISLCRTAPTCGSKSFLTFYSWLMAALIQFSTVACLYICAVTQPLAIFYFPSLYRLFARIFVKVCSPRFWLVHLSL